MQECKDKYFSCDKCSAYRNVITQSSKIRKLLIYIPKLNFGVCYSTRVFVIIDYSESVIALAQLRGKKGSRWILENPVNANVAYIRRSRLLIAIEIALVGF